MIGTGSVGTANDRNRKCSVPEVIVTGSDSDRKLETHGLFAHNTAFQHATRHNTTWKGQYRDATNGNIVTIYNTIDFVICRQSLKSLLTDSRAYAGTLLDSDHRLLIAQLDLSRLYYVWSEIAPSAKHTRYNTEQLASGRNLYRKPKGA